MKVKSRIADNPNMTVKERNLLKGAIRRVFARSDIRKAAIASTRVEHQDPLRPRVKKWSVCPSCKQFTPTYLMQADHILPLIPVDTTLADMSWDTVIDRAWCDKNNLNPICRSCHKAKTSLERKLRKKRKKNEPK